MTICRSNFQIGDAEHLEATAEHKQTEMDVLNWQGDEWLEWFGKLQDAYWGNWVKGQRGKTAITSLPFPQESRWDFRNPLGIFRKLLIE